MKLAVNAVIFGLNEALAEALVLAEEAGIDRALAYDVFADSAVGAPYVGLQADRVPRPGRDARGVRARRSPRRTCGSSRVLADEVGQAVPQSARNLDLVRTRRRSEVGGGRDFSTVAVHLRRRAGAPVAASGGGGEGR